MGEINLTEEVGETIENRGAVICFYEKDDREHLTVATKNRIMDNEYYEEIGNKICRAFFDSYEPMICFIDGFIKEYDRQMSNYTKHLKNA